MKSKLAFWGTLVVSYYSLLMLHCLCNGWPHIRFMEAFKAHQWVGLFYVMFSVALAKYVYYKVKRADKK